MVSEELQEQISAGCLPALVCSQLRVASGQHQPVGTAPTAPHALPCPARPGSARPCQWRGEEAGPGN